LASAPAPELKLVTWLAPSLPLELFLSIAARLETVLGRPTSLRSETRTSAPPPDEPDPFTTGEADIGFLCAPGFVWLSRRRPCPVALVPAAPVFDDPRNGGRPVHFSDVVVRRDHRAQSLADLRGGVFAYNDDCSLSGWLCMIERLGTAFFRGYLATGSHVASLEQVVAGGADAAAIDSNVLLRQPAALRARLRRVASWGPHPIQPVVARLGLPVPDIAQALLSMQDPALAGVGVRGFAPIDESAFAGVCR
jgi:ABC-type phosphate/phosphonate transport system substrate-binding protein